MGHRSEKIMQPKRRGIRRWMRLRLFLLMMVALLAGCSLVLLNWLNTPSVQQQMLSWVRDHSAWDISVESFHWDVHHSTIVIEKPLVTHRTNNHQFHASHLDLHYNPWALLRGAFRIRTLNVKAAHVYLQAIPHAEQRPKGIKLRKLMILRNLEIDEGIITDIAITLPKQRVITMSRLKIAFLPRLFRDVRLQLQLQTPRLTHEGEHPLAAEHISLAGTTDLSAWLNAAPYINDIDGALTITQGTWKNAYINEFTALAHIMHGRVSLESVEARRDDKIFLGSGYAEFDSQRSALHVEWPEPMPIPELMKATSFLRTEGTITGTIDWEGEAFSLEALSGSMAVDITHVSKDITDIPAHMQIAGTWKDGTLTVDDGTLSVADGTASVQQWTIDVPKKHMVIEFEGTNIPLLGVLGRFRNIDFHPAAGPAQCKGSFRGWAKDYTFDLEATAHNASYQGIEIETAQMTMALTYPQLQLQGSILQGGHQTGAIDLNIRYGQPRDDGYRAATMDLDAHIDGHQLDPSFRLVELTGIGRGTIAIDGPTTNYHGTGQFEIEKGSFAGMPIERAQSAFTLRQSEFTFQPATIEMPNIPLFDFTEPLVMAIKSGFRLKGTPMRGLTLDLEYESGSGLWTFHTIRYDHPILSGPPLLITGTGHTGAWNLAIRGTMDGAWLQVVPENFREVEGPMTLNLQLQGELIKPLLGGTVTFHNNWMLLRGLPQEWSDMVGVLRMQGRRITFDGVEGLLGDGPFTLAGWAEHDGLDVYPRFDLHLVGRSLYFSPESRQWRIEFDADTHIRRLDGMRMEIGGTLNLIDGKYTQDFRILEQATRTSAHDKRASMRKEIAGLDNMHLHLKVNSRGELWIRNNAADVALRADATITGTAAHPQVQGRVETTEGELHYLGLVFEVVNGSVEFQQPFGDPFIEVTGEEVINTHLVRVTLRGPADNIRVDLTSVPGEDRKNILCLVGYGVTCDQLRSAQFGAKVGPGVFVEQLGKILERPIQQSTGLNVRVESAVGTSDISRLHIGKRINDRLEVGFVTTVGQTAAEQSIEAAYQLTDFLLVKANQSSNKDVEVKLSLRFRER